MNAAELAARGRKVGIKEAKGSEEGVKRDVVTD